MKVYSHSSAMEPMLPSDNRDLSELALQLAKSTARLGGCVHPITGQRIAALVRSMNSYYSNLIEGHNTHPLEIERALKHDFSNDPAQRALQIESAAHIQVQEILENRLREIRELPICELESLCWIHRELYARLPEAFRFVKTKNGNTDEVIPGQLRRAEVEVGRHIAPRAESLPKFLARFSAAYKPSSLDPLTRIIAVAASHHRLAWIHPFLDGNGRVARLFTHASLTQSGLGGYGLWTISRGFARRKDEYLSALSAADAPRWNDYDGRGNLSDLGLAAFCKFFLECCLDQVQFMTGLLDFDTILERIRFFGDRWVREHKADERIVALLQQAFLRGELTRGETTQVLLRPERTTRRIISDLIAGGLLASEGPAKPVSLGFPMEAIGFYFPKLYPEGVEMELLWKKK
ncbi:MAG: filamentation induced by cAMP protein Fic [Verrucomicrobiales bacterium]|nr:filamentation induced by cAMP protein Fic [Verrucomicrobiales bacterium]